MRSRAGVAALLRVSGAVLAVTSLVGIYAQRVMLDRDAFAERAASALRDPRVASYLAERIADEAVARDRDLIAFRPLIVAGARVVVASEPFAALFRRAARSAHAVALSPGADRVYLSLPDFSVLVRNALARAQPELAAKVPAGLPEQLGRDAEKALAGGGLRFVRTAGRLDDTAALPLALAVLLLVASVALAVERRRALLSAGVALAAGGILLFLIVPLSGILLTSRIGDAPLQQAARGVFEAFVARLRVWALVLAGMGVVLSAAASSLASHVEVEEAFAVGWSWLHRPSQRRRVELPRALALLTLGLLAALQPSILIRILTVVVGAGLAFEGLRSLFALVAPRLAPPERAGVPRSFHWRLALVGVVALALLGAAVAWLRSPASLPGARFTGECNGSAALCDRTLDQVVFPGAHNAMAAADVPGWMLPNQEQGMGAQLRHGIRALLFDVHDGVPVAGRIKTSLAGETTSLARYEEAVGPQGFAAAMRIRDRLVGPPQGPQGPYLCHGFCELGSQPLVQGLREIRDFLIEDPGAVLVLIIEDYVPPAEIAQAFQESGLVAYVYRGRPGPPWPTLRRMIESDERVLATAEHENDAVPWYFRAYDLMEETPYHFESPGQLSCRPNRGGDGKSLFLMNHWIDTTPAPKPSYAELLNRRDAIVARARQCQRERGKLPNVIAVDFAMTGDVVGAAAELNGLK